jgi:glutaredoxin
MKKGLSLAVLLFAVAFCPMGEAEVYKMTGPDGRITYTDSRSEDSNGTKVEVVEIESYAGSAEVSSIEKAAASRKVTIFTTEWCGVCRKAKSYMASQGIAFDEFDIEKSRSARSRFDQLGARGVPVILVGKEKMTGFSAGKLKAMLDRAGI